MVRDRLELLQEYAICEWLMAGNMFAHLTASAMPIFNCLVGSLFTLGVMRLPVRPNVRRQKGGGAPMTPPMK